MRIYNPGPEINVVHGRSGINAKEIAAREAMVKAGKRGGPVGRPRGFVVPAQTALDVPDEVGLILLRAHSRDGLVRIDRPTTEAKQRIAADNTYVLKHGKAPESVVPVVPEPEPVQEPVAAKKKAAKKKDDDQA